jgi:hypothetical protein
MLQELRAANLVVLKSKTLTIPNLEALMSAALFNPAYLHLNQAGEVPDTVAAVPLLALDERSDGLQL